jgi:polysaccharide biosynthesis protein PslG
MARQFACSHAPFRATVAALAAALAALVLGTPAQAAEVGVVADVTWGQTRQDVDREIELLRAAGARWIRANVNWAGLEPDRKGELNDRLLAEYDYAVQRAHAAGLQVLMPIADGVPYWASADPGKHLDADGAPAWEVTYRPSDAADYGDIVRRVVEHFSVLGVHTFQVWNEPNHPRFWPSGPSAAAYLPLLRAGYEAAKAADPSATVLLGGLSKSDFYYLEDLYRLGGGAYFDAVAVQPYTFGVDPTASWNGVHDWEDPDRISINAFPAVKEIRASMVAFGDSGKDVWLTGFGYSTTTQDGGVTPLHQAAYLRKAYRYVERLPWVKALFWYAARNSPFFHDADTYEGRFGLLTTGWRPKPSYLELRSYALGLPELVLRKSAQRRLATRRPAASVTLRGRVARPAASSAPVRAMPKFVVLQRRASHGWARVTRVRAGLLGRFRVQLVARGRVVRYRAVAGTGDFRAQSRVVCIRLR